MSTGATLALACVAILLYTGRRILGSRTSYPLPPQPPGIPWVGNVIGISASTPWLTYAKWARTYGDIFYTQLFGKAIIIVNSERVAKDLLEDRSKIYSSRPCLVIHELTGVDFHSALLPYGSQWRDHRRTFHQSFRPGAVPRFLPLLHRKACHLLQQLLSSPEQLDNHVFEYTISIMLSATYGYDPMSPGDELVKIVTDALKPGKLPVPAEVAIMLDAFPLLLHLPSWFPGMAFRKQMATMRASLRRYIDRPFECSLQTLSDNTTPSMIRDVLARMEAKGIPLEEPWIGELKNICGTALAAASETSHAMLMTFFLLMVLNPVAQAKAQAQIDAVVGNRRLPMMDDRPLLPFVDAIFREVLRYNPITPLSVPHSAVDDDVYNGFHIPKGAMIMTNVWSIAHDESRYPNPHTFIPERFLNDDGSLKHNDVEHITFGFGRRMCVGRYFADPLVWEVIVKVLAVFKILKPLDENGMEIPVEPKFTSGVTIRPRPFGYRIVPRFPGMDADQLGQMITASTAQ